MKRTVLLFALSCTFLYSCGQTAEEHFNQGSEKLKAQNFQEAVSDYDKAIKLNPNHGDAYKDRGFAKIYLADLNGALADLNKAIELNPKQEETYYNRGIVKTKLKDFKASIDDYSKAIELNPNYIKAYGNRGISKGKLQDYKGAIADYDKAISLDPNYTIALINRGNAKYNMEDLNGACQDWRKAKELGDNRVDAQIAEQCGNIAFIDTTKIYTPSGELASINVWDKSKSYHTLLYKKIFWESLPNGKYVFVSKDGFVTVKDGKTVKLDSSTPDNVIDTSPSEDYTSIYIWKNGKKELYTGGRPDGSIETIYEGENAGVYEWNNGERKLKRKLTKKDLEEKEKGLKEDEDILKNFSAPK
jgi:tetratricopeptide (TPR) repeat protein